MKNFQTELIYDNWAHLNIRKKTFCNFLLLQKLWKHYTMNIWRYTVLNSTKHKHTLKDSMVTYLKKLEHISKDHKVMYTNYCFKLAGVNIVDV